MSFKKGANPLQFSWANTLIDPTSVELRFLTHADKLDLLDTTFPHDKPQMLYWNVQSEMDGEATIEITYFTSGISWSADYVCIANPDETQMGFEGFVRVSNNSGEEYEDAQVRLVVGKINLVEKIAQLAQHRARTRSRSWRTARSELRRQGCRRCRWTRPMREAGRGCRGERQPAKPKEIIKEGLSEYFIYTIEGTETIPNGWSQADAELRGPDGAVQDPVPLPARPSTATSWCGCTC